MNGIQNTSTNNFNAIIGNNKKFMVPKFQRDYSWTSEQWDDLWQDKDVKECVGLLNVFRLKQPFSVLMAAKLNLSDAEFKRLFKTIIKMCFRYNVICDRNPND